MREERGNRQSRVCMFQGLITQRILILQKIKELNYFTRGRFFVPSFH